MWASGYIHMNAVKDGFITHPAQHQWSSYNDYINDRNLPIVHTDFLLSAFGSKENFEEQTLGTYQKSDVSKGIFDIAGLEAD